LSKIRGRPGNAKADIAALNDFLLGLLQEHFEDLFPRPSAGPGAGAGEEEKSGKKRSRASDASEASDHDSAGKKGGVPMTDKQKVGASERSYIIIMHITTRSKLDYFNQS
jgi:hypothetical protein